jgi:protein-disulfide isomerase
MRRGALLLLSAALLCLPGCAKAQEKKAEGATDPASIERFLRRYYNLPDSVRVELGPLKPSAVPGLMEATVRLSQNDQHQDELFLISSDGRYLVKGPLVKVGSDPFALIREKIELKNHPALGPETAPVTVVEYTDFQCPFCRGIAGVLKDQMVPDFKGQMRLVFKDFPLDFHPWAMPAAQLGRCIYKRYGDEAFWAYHDWAFRNQPDLNAQNFKQKALEFEKTMNLDDAQLSACVADPQTKAEVAKSLAEALDLKVTGTPTMFINGRVVVGNLPLEELRANIQKEVDFATGKAK